jgi:hypothetical protein
MPLTKYERVDGAIVRKDFSKAIQDKGGDAECQQDSTEALTYEMFDCSSRKLYEETGGLRGKRETLPKEAQKAYLVAETVATHDLQAHQVRGRK